MGRQLKNWRTFWKETEAPGMDYKDLLSIYKESYEIISVDPFPDRTVWLMRAYAYASRHKLSMPTWVIKGLNSNENLRRCRFFTAASKEKHVDSNEAIERTGLKDYELAAKVFKDEIEWGIKSGNWLPEETQAVWRNRVKDDGLIWIDKEDMTHFLVLDNLDDFLFPESAIIKLEKGTETKTREVIDDRMKEIIPASAKEIRLVHEVMKKKVRIKRSEKPLLREKALEAFHEHGHTFEYLERKHLEDIKVYDLNDQHGKRDFYGTLLQKIIFERTGEKPPSIQDLFNYYKSTEKVKVDKK